MTEQDFNSGVPQELPESGKIGWQAPSNIALVKYWGKKAGQIPTNPSVSFTLETSATRTELRYRKASGTSPVPDFKVFLEGTPAPHFEDKIREFFKRILAYQPFLANYEFEIHTENTFPHSSGIASSASGMAALALCLMELERSIFPDTTEELFYRKASFMARLGSGSAARSIQGNLVLWGSHPPIPGSSDLYGIPYPLTVAPVYKTFQDTILLVDKGPKKVSSSVGHGLMKSHPYAPARFDQARSHIDALMPIFRDGDLDGFIALVA